MRDLPVLLLVLGISACDFGSLFDSAEEGADRVDAEAKKAREATEQAMKTLGDKAAEAEAKAEAAKAEAAAAPAAALRHCHDACTQAEGLSDTDRATCHLNCDAASAEPPPPPGPTAKLDPCLEACRDDKGLSNTDRATCRVQCAEAFVSAAGASACARPCATARVDCERRCDDEPSTDDRSTCALLCRQANQHCVARCPS